MDIIAQPIYSNNYNNGLIVDQIELFNLPFKASEESKSLEGFGLEISSYTNLKLIDEPFYSLGFSLAAEALDYPSYKGDIYSVQAGLNYDNFSLSYPIQLRYVFVKRNFGDILTFHIPILDPRARGNNYNVLINSFYPSCIPYVP